MSPSDPTAAPVPGRVSVVVPTRDSARTLAACLSSARAQTHHDVEIIVVDNGSEDETMAVALTLADRTATWGPERSAQRNRGAALATGELLLFLDSDMTLEPGVVAEASELFDRSPSCGAAVIPELAHGRGFLAGCRALEKRLYLGDASVEAARVFRRTAFEMVGGYDEDLTATEDWDLPDRVRRAGFGIGRTRSFAWHDEGRVQLGPAFAKKRYYGRWVVRYAARPRGERRPLGRSSLVSRPHLLLRSPARSVGLAVLKAVECAGILVGMVEARRPQLG